MHKTQQLRAKRDMLSAEVGGDRLDRVCEPATTKQPNSAYDMYGIARQM